MTGVQIIGKGDLIDRYNRLGAQSWAIYQGKQFIVGGTDAGDLDEWLSTFEKTGSTATYYLRTYDYKEQPTSSNGNSDYTSCIAFKLVDQYDGYGIAGHSTKLMERIGALEKKLEEKEDPEEGEGLNEIIMGWLNDPVKLGQVAGAVRQIFGKDPLPASGQTIGSITGQQPEPTILTDDAKLQRVSVALDKLERKDTKLLIHLEKLAALAESDPTLFNSVISKLDIL